MRTRPRVVGAVCVLAVLAVGCTSSQATPDDDPTTTASSPSPSPTTTATPSTSPTGAGTSSSPDDPFALPDPVTEEYVDRVVNTIYEEWGAITRELLQQPADPTAITPVETRERMATLFASEYLQRRFEEADGILRGEREGLLPAEEFKSVSWTTQRVLSHDQECLVVIGEFDTTRTAVSGRSILMALSLHLHDITGAPAVTPWRILDGQSNTGEGGKVLPDQVMLEASPEDLAPVLDVACEQASQ